MSAPCGIDVASLYINTIISFRCCSVFISSFKQNTKKNNTANFMKRRKKNTIFPMSSLSRKKSKQIIDTIYLYIKNKYLFIVRCVYLHHLEMIIVQLLWMFFIWIDFLSIWLTKFSCWHRASSVVTRFLLTDYWRRQMKHVIDEHEHHIND